MATPPDPQLATSDCDCPAGMITMQRLELHLACTDCGKTRITITGCLGHMAEILAALAAP